VRRTAEGEMARPRLDGTTLRVLRAAVDP